MNIATKYRYDHHMIGSIRVILKSKSLPENTTSKVPDIL